MESDEIVIKAVEPIEFVIDPVTGKVPPCLMEPISREELLKKYPPAK